ncbi:MAG TPA: protein-disulfide reductase DsbD domain-containing protein [Candidatus Baltobacteraceae bacterium]|nr:protein-disulfide reductase DsbD domain-containing protein [Candidatus Baltobacteraceae bacterium]
MISAKSLRYFLAASALAGIAVAGGRNARAQEAPALTPAQVVKSQVYVSMEPVARGKDFEVAVVANINEAYHMNSHKPSDAYLIPTTITPKLPEGLTLVDSVYPPGRDKKFTFSDKPLNVYTGSVTFKLKLTASTTAALGDVTIPITLRYQACNSSACLPPVKIPLEATVKIAAAGAAGHAVHPEVFRAGK